MRTPALAIAWEFRRRCLWVLIAMAGYLLVLGSMKLLILGPGQPIGINPPDERAAVVIVPLSTTFLYLLAVFSFGLAGDLSARQSIYPARMFALPVTTRALAGWPMLYGTAVMASLWLATALVARWPWEIDVPLIWPALLGAAFLAWTQALAWMPYGLRGLRVIVAALWLAALDAVVLLAIHFKASETLMIAILAPQIPLAYLAACVAVERARRGDVPDWSGCLARVGRIVDVRRRQRKSFLSPARAQTWFEWRRHGRTLPAMAGIVVPFELSLLFIPGNDTAPVLLLTLFAVLLTPPFLAVFAAVALSAPTSDIATRPMTSAALVAAKLKMAIWSTLAAWLLVLTFIPVALILSGTMPILIDRARAGMEVTGTVRGIAVALLVLTALIASTWKNLVQSLCIGLTGRGWIIKSTALLAVAFLIVLVPLAEWRALRSALWNGLPWILAALVAFKTIAASWIAICLHERRLLSDRALVTGAVCWLGAVLALYGLLEWFAASPLAPRYFLGAIAILLVPLARVSAAPLALAWGRHR